MQNCKYGAECFRNNEEHMMNFRHPQKLEERAKLEEDFVPRLTNPENGANKRKLNDVDWFIEFTQNKGIKNKVESLSSSSSKSGVHSVANELLTERKIQPVVEETNEPIDAKNPSVETKRPTVAQRYSGNEGNLPQPTLLVLPPDKCVVASNVRQKYLDVIAKECFRICQGDLLIMS